jgi:hypothetical protein
MLPSDFCSELMFLAPEKVLLRCQGDASGLEETMFVCHILT